MRKRRNIGASGFSGCVGGVADRRARPTKSGAAAAVAYYILQSAAATIYTWYNARTYYIYIYICVYAEGVAMTPRAPWTGGTAALFTSPDDRISGVNDFSPAESEERASSRERERERETTRELDARCRRRRQHPSRIHTHIYIYIPGTRQKHTHLCIYIREIFHYIYITSAYTVCVYVYNIYYIHAAPVCCSLYVPHLVVVVSTGGADSAADALARGCDFPRPNTRAAVARPYNSVFSSTHTHTFIYTYIIIVIMQSVGVPAAEVVE